MRRVGGQKREPSSASFDELPYPGGPVRPEFVEHHNLPLRERRSQKVLYVNLEGFCIGSALDAHGLSHPMNTHGGYEGGVLAAVSWHLAVGSKSLGSPRAQSIHRSVHP